MLLVYVGITSKKLFLNTFFNKIWDSCFFFLFKSKCSMPSFNPRYYGTKIRICTLKIKLEIIVKI